jgi:carbonic anhydrase
VKNFGKLTLHNYAASPLAERMVNTGHSIMIDICDVGSRHPKISGGGLNGSYIFHQLHFHWSDDDSRGSEHTKSGTSFPLEVQLIHYKEEFGSIQQAREEPDGLAILSILFQVLIQTNYY